MGYPSPQEGQSPEEAEKEWSEILTNISKGFRCVLTNDGTDDWWENPDYQLAMKLFAEHFPSFWD